MKSTRLTFSAATLAALTTVALFGCGGGGDSTTDPTPSPTPTVGPTPTPSPTPTPTPPPLTATGRVRFIEGTNTVEANPDGSNKVVVGPGRSRGALSPDGTRVVYLGSTYINGSPELYIENADGTNTRPLGVGTRGVKAVWSPDGTKIAYSDRGAPVTIGSVTGSSDELWSINPDGTGAKQLTVSLSAGYGGDFAWSPDGTKFVFAAFIAGKQKAYIVNADGTGLRRLNDDDTFTPERDVRWTKANKIYYRDSGDYVKSIYRVNPDGTGTQRVFGLENSATVPLIGTYAVSPDETYVAFNGTLPGSGTAGDVTSVYIAQIGSAAYRLLATGGEINDWR